MIFLLAALAALLGGEPTGPTSAPESPASVTITPETVDLDGAGKLIFEPELQPMLAVTPAGVERFTFTVRLWMNATGKPMSCDMDHAQFPQIARIGCAQLMKSATFALYPGMALPLRRGFLDVEFSYFRGMPADIGGREMFAFALPAYKNTNIIYPPDATRDEQRLTKDDGSFAASIAPDDYPPQALRENLVSVSAVLMGIDRSGQVRTCRPITNGGQRSTAMLDNHTCVLLIRRGHFVFGPGARDYSGLRYWRQSLSWKIPVD